MNRMIRSGRAVLATACLWAGMWGGAGLLFDAWLSYWVGPASEAGMVLAGAGRVAVRWAVLGLVSGAVFAALFTWSERRKSIAELLSRRIAVWGALAGGSLPVVAGAAILLGLSTERVAFGSWLAQAAFGGALGAGCASLWLAIARHGTAGPAARGSVGSGREGSPLRGHDAVRSPLRVGGIEPAEAPRRRLVLRTPR